MALILGCGGAFLGIFSWLIKHCHSILEPYRRKWPELLSMASHNPWTMRTEPKNLAVTSSQTCTHSDRLLVIIIFLLVSSHQAARRRISLFSSNTPASSSPQSFLLCRIASAPYWSLAMDTETWLWLTQLVPTSLTSIWDLAFLS